MKIAVAGPTGQIGRKLVQKLLQSADRELILLARDPGKLREEQARGAQIARCDLEDANALQCATRGVDALFWLIPPRVTAPEPRAYQRSVARAGADACRANRIRHVVLLSSIGGHLESGTGPILGLHDAEQLFREVLPGLTILRPAYFMENYIHQVASIRQSRSIFLPVPGDVRAPMIATRDIADVAARSLTGAVPAQPRIAPLHGPRDYGFGEAARLIGEALGEEVRHVEVTPDQARQAMLGMGMSEGAAETMLELYRAMGSGHLRPECARSPETTTPTTFEEFAGTTLLPLLGKS